MTLRVLSMNEYQIDLGPFQIYQLTHRTCSPPRYIGDDDIGTRQKLVEQIGLKDKIPDDWTLVIVVDGNFATIMAFTLTHLSLGYQCASDFRLDAGFVYLMHSGGGSKKDFLRLLIQDCTPESNDTRTIHFEKVRAFRLEPEIAEEGAYVTIDVEALTVFPTLRGACAAEILSSDWLKLRARELSTNQRTAFQPRTRRGAWEKP
eukprot:sb/3470513/